MFYTELHFSEPSAYLLLGKTYVNENGELALPWNDSGFSFRFFGTGAILHFASYPGAEVAYLRVWIDGCNSRRYAITNGSEKIVIDGLSEGTHEIRVLRVTEGMDEITVIKVDICGKQPKLLAPPAERPLRLAFIGDSITCGYGVVGAATTAGYVTYEQDSSRSYAYDTADLLNAEVMLSGASGKGIVANCEGNREDMTLRQAFQWKNRQGGQWDHSTWVPDLTVINAGTNDSWGGVSDEEFISVAKLLLQEVRTAYPDKPILWCYGVMDQNKLSAVQKAVEEFNAECGNTYMLAVDSMYQFADETGGGGHPNTITSARVSKLLAEKIREILG